MKHFPISDTHVPQARLAGLSYLVILGAGLWSEVGVRMQLVVPGDALATWQRTQEAGPLLSYGIAADLVMLAADILLAVLLFRLFRPVSAPVARTAMVLRLAQAAVIAASLTALVAGVLLVEGGDPAEAHRLLGLFETHAAGYDAGLIFFGLNTVLTAWLLCRSGWTGRWLPGLLMLAGLVYLAGSLTRFLAPEINVLMQPAYLVPVVAESAFALTLLAGLRPRRAAQAA